ncbi:MAG: NADH-quinone oxidoreductase subunit C, partial [Candidatus Binatia bacterium]
MAISTSLSLRPNEPAQLRELPFITPSEFRNVVLNGVAEGGRLAVLFGRPLDRNTVQLIAVLAYGNTGGLSVSSTRVRDAYQALTPDCSQAHWFEREIAEQWGIRPEGHPWLKPIRFHASYRPDHVIWPSKENDARLPSVTDFFQMQGEEVHEVAVGPVHAGVIEPGHFRFQCHGEHV